MFTINVPFSTLVANSYKQAEKASMLFVPSRAQVEQQLQSVVDFMLSLPDDQVQAWVKQSFKPDTWDAVTVKMYQEQLQETEGDVPEDDVDERDYVGYESASPARLHDDGYYAKNEAGEYSWM